MKKNHLMSLLLLCLMWLSGTTMKAVDVVDDVYQIGTAEDLAAFAELVNAGEKSANAVLTADIDFSGYQTMIGNNDIRYAGTFDGAYHTVKVAYAEPEYEYTALFQYLSGTVKNLRVEGTITTGKKYAAGIAGNLDGGTVDGCISAVSITSSVDGDATHGGIAGTSTNNATVQNSISAFTLRGELTTNCGGIVGWLSGTTYLYNNLTIADIEIMQENGSATFCRNAGNQKGGNNYYLANYGAKDNNATQVTAEQLKSGEICFLLNGNNDAIRFYQTIGEDELPVLDPTHKQVYAQGDVRCDGTAANGTLTYTNTVTPKPDHHFEAGFCTVCGLVQADFVTLSDDGFYLIGNIEQMEWFAAQVNAGKTTIKGRLTASLNYDGFDHQTIGTTGNTFKGTFDGGHFPILNIESMLFGSIDGATIENVDLRGGTIKQNGEYAAHTGTIVGNAGVTSNKSIIRNCSSTADLLNVSTDAGGIVGKLTGTVENCYYGGNLIDGTSTAGGIIGSSNNVYTVVRNCLVTSQTITGNPSYLGNFVGYFHGGSVLDNCYVLEGGSGLANMAGNNGGSITNCEIVSADALASGEIAYILNGKQSEDVAFYQTIGEDAVPVLDPSHKTVYANGALNCDGTPVGGSLTYSNNQTSTRPDHEFENGTCKNCGYVDVNFATLNANGYYEIDSAAKLEWFSAMVAAGNTDFKALQTADIDLDGIEHKPIGNKTVMYVGTYDGQNYTISNLNAMLFGVINGATLTRIQILSGDIQADDAVAAHVGTLAGAVGTAKANTISYCGSLANISGASCDAGGMVGKMYGTISNCYFGGNLDCASTTAGMAGSSYDADHAVTISNCVVYSTTLNGTEAYLGNYVGYAHENSAINNCYACTPVSKDAGYNGGSSSGNKTATEEQVTSGELTWILNGNSFINPKWYQTVGDDAGPVLMPSHGLIYKISDEEYGCQTDAETLKAMVTFLAQNARDYGTDAVAQQSLKDEYLAAVAGINTEITNREQLMDAYAEVDALRKSVEASEKVYKTYEAKVLEILAYMNEHEEITGPWKELLMDYLESEMGPSDEMPNGSSMYILETLELDAAQVNAEIEFAQHLMEAAIANDIKPGSDITNLLTNANFTDGFNGWQGKKGTGTGGVKEVMTVGETWNATMNMYQTLTDMPNGVYELQAYAAYRPYATPASTQQASVLYANDNKVYVSNVIEDMVTVENAIDQVNCYITEGGSNPDYEIYDNEGEVMGYVMHGYNSASYGFSAGRHLNHILVNVTDGKLTVGLNTMGSGLDSDWTAFADFRLFYCGSLEQSGEALDRTLADQVARANTLLYNYEPLTSDEEYAKYPNFSAELRSELEAAVAAVEGAAGVEEKYTLVEKFSQLFQDIYDCKMAYVNLIKKLTLVDAKLWEMNEQGGVSAEAIKEEKAAFDLVWNKYIDGAYSLDEARAQEDITSLMIYKYVYGEQPEVIDGVYQIASASNLRWFQLEVNSGAKNMKALQTAPLDLSTVAIDPIGTPSNMFTGSYDGQFYPINNVSCMLFGTVNGADITRVAIESGTITMNADYATHTGSIVGAVGTDMPNSITLSYSKADLVDCSNDAGGIAGKYYGLIENCYYAGNITCTSTTGGILGSSYDGNYPPEVKNCHVYSQVLEGNATYLGVFAGYIHGNSLLQDCYGLNGVTSKTVGYMGGVSKNMTLYSADEFASGAIAYVMNENAGENVWFQTLGQDAYPVLDSSRGLVVKNEDGSYGNITAVERIETALSDRVNVYDMQGRVIRRNVTRANSLINLPKGIYVVGDRKVAK